MVEGYLLLVQLVQDVVDVADGDRLGAQNVRLPRLI
jgi:hypothetical protein